MNRQRFDERLEVSQSYAFKNFVQMLGRKNVQELNTIIFKQFFWHPKLCSPITSFVICKWPWPRLGATSSHLSHMNMFMRNHWFREWLLNNSFFFKLKKRYIRNTEICDFFILFFRLLHIYNGFLWIEWLDTSFFLGKSGFKQNEVSSANSFREFHRKSALLWKCDNLKYINSFCLGLFTKAKLQ